MLQKNSKYFKIKIAHVYIDQEHSQFRFKYTYFKFNTKGINIYQLCLRYISTGINVRKTYLYCEFLPEVHNQ